MEVMELVPVKPNRLFLKPSVELKLENDLLVAALEKCPLKKKKQFIEANTIEVSLDHLKNECVVPVFSKDNELTISHVDFIETVREAVCRVFPTETIDIPEIRVSHLIKGRTPDAIHKTIHELTEEDKTLYYDRMIFVIEIPSICEDVNGNTLTLSVGGVRSYNQENLYSKKTLEKFKVFIGFKNLVCCNLCVSSDGFKEEIRVMDSLLLLKKTMELIQGYNISKDLNKLKVLKNYNLNESQFAQLLGKARLYQSLPLKDKKRLSPLEFNDSHLSLIARNYYRDEDFCRYQDGSLNLWSLYNLFTASNKNSYIDSFLHRANNATDFIGGISEALNGNDKYKWFIS